MTFVDYVRFDAKMAIKGAPKRTIIEDFEKVKVMVLDNSAREKSALVILEVPPLDQEKGT
jgi:hypothetical protein